MMLVIVLPIILLLISGLSTHAILRERRLGLLRQLGVSERWLIQLGILESLMVMAPIALIVTPLASLYLRTLDRTPFIGRQVVRGDLGLSTAQCAAVVGSAVGLVILVSVVRVVVVLRVRGFGQVLTKLYRIFVVVAMLVAAYLAIVLAPQNMRNGRALTLFVANLMIVLAVVPTILRQLLVAIGGLLERSGRTLVQLGGARLGYLSRVGVGPTVGIALVLVVVLQVFGLVTMFKGYAVFVDDTVSPSSAEIRASMPFDSLESEMTSKFPDSLVFPVYHGISSSRGEIVTVFGIACGDVAAYLNRDQSLCETDSGVRSDVFGQTFFTQSAKFDPSYSMDEFEPDSLMMVSNDSMHMVDQNVRESLPPAEFPGVVVTTPDAYQIKEPRHTPWKEQGAIAAVAILRLAVLFRAIDQSMGDKQYTKQLISVGASVSTLRLTHLVFFIVPGMVAVALGMFLGVAELVIFRRMATFSLGAVPIVPVALVSVVSVVLASVLVADLNTRVARAEEKSE